MPVADLAIDLVNRRVSRTSGSDTFSVRAMYSWLQDQMDELTTLDDKVIMSGATPTDFTLINGWYIDQSVYQYLTGGSITTLGWDGASYSNGVYVLTFGVTYTNAVAGDIGKTVVQGANNGVLLGYDNTAKKWWVRKGTGTIIAGATTITTGTGAGTSTTVATGESLYSNVYTLTAGSLESGTQMYVEQNGTVLTSYWGTGHIDLVLKVKEAGTLINSGLVRVFAREYSDNYFHVQVDLSAGGRNPVGASTTDDSNNQTASATVATWTTTTTTFGTVSRNLNNGSGAKNYDVIVDAGGRTVAQMYERLKYITRRGETASLNGAQGQLYRAAGAYSEVTASPFGTFAGGKFFGARGVWITNYDASDAQNFQLIASDGTSQVPPNTVGITVGNLVSGDRVGVFVLSGPGGSVVKNALTSAASGNSTSSGTVTVTTSIPAATPQAGWLTFFVDANTERVYPYVSWTGSTFTLAGTLAENNNSLSVYVPIIRKQAAASTESNTLIYQGSTIPVLVVVRRGTGGAGVNLVPFEVEGTITATGLSVNAIRQIDTINTNP